MVNGHKPELTLMERLRNRGRDYSKLLCCPLDDEPLEVVGEELVCKSDHHHFSKLGIIHLLNAGKQAQFDQAAQQRAAELRAKGWTVPPEDGFKALPQTALPGWGEGYWADRAFATAEMWRFLEEVRRDREIPPIGDQGTAVEFTGDMGWLGYCLDVAGFATVVVGQDTSEYGLNAYRYGRYPRVQADLSNPPITPNAFDVVLYSYCLHQLTDITGVLSRAAKLLKLGGYMIVITDDEAHVLSVESAFQQAKLRTQQQKVGAMGSKVQKLATSLRGGPGLVPLLIGRRVE